MLNTNQAARGGNPAVSWEISGLLEDIQGIRRKLRGQDTVIHFGTYNIWNGRNIRLKLDLQGMSQTNLDLGVFQETKVIDGNHTRASSG